MRRKTTWMMGFFAALLLVLFMVISFTWDFLFHQVETLPNPPPYLLIYESVFIGAAFGVLSVVAALAVAVPATAVAVITVVVLLAFSGKSPKSLVGESRKITREVAGYFGRALLKEGNAVAAVFTVLGYFALVNWNRGPFGVLHSHGMVRE